MDDDKEGLKRLIKQRIQRPCYTRTISLEFSRSETSQPVQRKQRKSSKKNSSSSVDTKIEPLELDSDSDNSDVLDDSDKDIQDDQKNTTGSGNLNVSSSDESEYFSADDEINSDSSSDDSTTQICDNLSELDYLIYSDSEKSESDSDSAFCSVNSSGAKGNIEGKRSTQHHKAPSKKQKRKRRKEKTLFLNDLPFSGLENFDYDFCDTKNIMKENAEKITVMKSVPSLSELCIFAARKLGRQRETPSTTIPYQIKKIIGFTKTKANFQKFQLSWLYRLLAFYEQKEESGMGIVYYKENDKRKLLIPTRNIWNYNLNLEYLCNNSTHGQFNGCKAASYIPYTYLPHTALCEYGYDAWAYDQFIVTRSCMAAYAAMVDLMLPPLLKVSPHRKKRPSGNSKQVDNEASVVVKNLIQRMEAVLKQRFPKTTNYFFHMVLPYVFWARGNLGHAAEAFTVLVEKEHRCRIKALYLFEIGRMHAQFDEPEEAKTCFRLASEAALGKSKNSVKDEIVNEVNRQTLMLTANAYDQGLITEEKAIQSASFWKAGVVSPKPDSLRCDGIWSYIESFLCYHAWTIENGSASTASWLDEAQSRISSLTKNYPEMHYYLSMIHALQGKSQESSDAFKCFVYGGGTSEGNRSPGLFMIDQISPKIIPRGPWNVLIDLIKGSVDVKPLRVVWRVQLSPLSVSDKCDIKNVFESDIRNKQLNLRLSSEGYITGDMQLALPPVRGIYLEPYTGNLCFPHVPVDTEIWQGVQTDAFEEILNYPNRKTESNLIVPTLTELYKDDVGNFVHLLYPSMYQALHTKCYKLKSQQMILTWTGADGQKARLNLLAKLKQKSFEGFVHSLHEPKNKKITDVPKWKEKMIKIAQLCVVEGVVIDHKTISDFVYAKWGNKTKTKTTKKGFRPGKALRPKKDPYLHKKLYELEVGQHVVFGTTILIQLNADNQPKLVFIDCTSKASFLNPVIVSSGKNNLTLSDNLEFKSILKDIQLKNADVVFKEDTNGDYVIYDKAGVEFDRIKKDEIQSSLPVIVDRTKTCFIDNKSLRSYCNGEEHWGEQFGPVEKLLNIRNTLVLLTENSVKFADGVSFLPLIILKENDRPLSVSLSEDSMELVGKFDHVFVLDEQTLTDEHGCKYTRAVLALDNHLLILSISQDVDNEVVTIPLCIALPGLAKEVCFIGEKTGFLVTVTQHASSTSHYSENLYYFDHCGRLRNYLLCLGPGPRSFLPVYLPVDTDVQENKPGFGQCGWYVYMRDGHDGIIAVYLHS